MAKQLVVSEHPKCGYNKPCGFVHLKVVNRDAGHKKRVVLLCLFDDTCNQQVWG